MRFKDFLNEADGIAILRPFAKNIRLMQRTRKYLFRSVDNSFEEPILKVLNAEVHVQDKLSKRRVSRSDNSLKMFLASTWKGFPDRTLSTFASFSFNPESQFGDATYLCIPADSVNLFGYTPTDFNEDTTAEITALTYILSSAEEVLRRLSTIDKFSKTVEDIINKNAGTLKSASNNLLIDHLQNAIKVVDDLLDNSGKILDELKTTMDNGKYPLAVKTFSESMQNLKKDLTSAEYSSFAECCEHFTPEFIDAKSSQSFASFDPSGDEDEVWFMGDALLVKLASDEDEDDMDGEYGEASDFDSIIDEMAKMVK